MGLDIFGFAPGVQMFGIHGSWGWVLSLHPEPTELGGMQWPNETRLETTGGANIPLYDNWQNDFWRGNGIGI